MVLYAKWLFGQLPVLIVSFTLWGRAIKQSKLTLKPYLQQIENQCNQTDHATMVKLILNLARNIAPGKRQEFLQSFQSALSNVDQPEKNMMAEGVGALVQGITAIHSGVSKRLKSIEDGSYWDEPDEHWEDEYSYDDDAPALLSDEQISALQDYFSEAGQLFLDGEKKCAFEVYEVLFGILTEVGEHGFLPDLNVDLREERARYCRCIYELSTSAKRVERLLDAIIRQENVVFLYTVETREYPIFQDIIDADPAPLDGLDDFLPEWQKTLMGENYRDNRVADLVLEACVFRQDIEVIGQLAELWGKDQPKGYLFWLDLFVQEGRWEKVREIADRALRNLPQGQARYLVADLLIEVGKQLANSDVILTGYRERFQSQPNSENLTTFIAEAKRQGRRATELERALTLYMENADGSWWPDLTTQIIVMTGRFDEAFKREEKAKCYGWSSGNVGLIYYGCLYLLTRGNDKCVLIQEGIRQYSGQRNVFFTYSHHLAGDEGDASEEIFTGLRQAGFVEESVAQYWNWCQKMVEKRVKYILSNQHRNAYKRAAQVLCALAESMIVTDRQSAAKDMLHNYCCVKFTRFRAFRQEMRKMAARSPLIRSWEKDL